MTVAEEMLAAFTEGEATVAAQGTVIDSAVAAFGVVSEQQAALNAEIARLQALIDAGGGGVTPEITAAMLAVTERSKALTSTEVAFTQRLSAAIPVNTSAARRS